MTSLEDLTENNSDKTVQPTDTHILDQSTTSSEENKNPVDKVPSMQSSDGIEFLSGSIESLCKPSLNEEFSHESQYSAQDLTNLLSKKSEDKNDKKTVQSLNIQLLNQSKMNQCISSYINSLEDDRKKLFQELIHDLCPLDQFITVYNEKQKDKAEKNLTKEKIEEKENYFIYEYEKDRENSNIDFAKIYYCKKEYVTRIQKSEISNSEATKKYDLLIFFVLKNENLEVTNIFSATTGNAWQVVRPYNDITFPIKIIKAVGSVEKIKKIERRSLFENAARETLFHPRHINLYQTSSLYYLVETVRCEMHEESGKELLDLLGKKSSVESFDELNNSSSDNQLKLSDQPPRKKRKIDSIVYPDVTITTAGSVILDEECEVQYYFKILKFLESYLSTEVQPNNNNFDFLHFFEAPDERKYFLDDMLVEDIYDRFKHDKEQYVTVRHKFYEDFLLSKKFEIQILKHKHFKDIGSVAPDIHTIIHTILQEFEDKDIDVEAFKTQMKIGKLRFSYKSDSFTGPIVDYIEGEIFHAGQHYFKIRSTWYQMDVDYLSLLQQDFEKVMNETFVRDVEEGGLPLSWKKDIPLDQTKLQKVLNFSESEMAKLMKELRNMNVSYISNDEVVQKELVGEILRIPKIKKYKNEIEFALNNCSSPSKNNWCNVLQKQISERDGNNKKKAKDLKKDIEDIWKELNKVRPVLTGERDNSTLVKNPFPYRLDIGLKYQTLTQFLTDISVHQKEDDYNRSYQDINLKGYNYLVFDQVCPDYIEPCDILCYTNDKIYLYHVKEVFGQCTRDVCSQILNSATRIQEALRTNQEDHYLKQLWRKAIEYNEDEKWRIALKNKLLSAFDEESFVDLFCHREIVFVYAYRTPRGFQKSHPRKPISDTIINACKKLEFVNHSGVWTSQFFQMSKETFFNKLYDYDNTIKEKESNEAFDTIVFDFINNLCKRSGYLNKFAALTTKFLHTHRDKFVSELLSRNNEIGKTMYEEAYDRIKERVFSNSVLAKMEVIRLAERLGTFQSRFKFKICEIPIE